MKEKRIGLGHEFFLEIDQMLTTIQANPRLFPGRRTIHKIEVRSALLTRFPFLIHYHAHTNTDKIVVEAVWQTSRKPFGWKKRI